MQGTVLAGAVARLECAYAPAYLHKPAGPGRTTVVGSYSLGGAPRDYDDDALCASGAQPFTGWDSGVGAAEYASDRGIRVIPRIVCHAGVTGFCGKRVSRGVPKGIFQRGN